jgi:hypothetical protein
MLPRMQWTADADRKLLDAIKICDKASSAFDLVALELKCTAVQVKNRWMYLRSKQTDAASLQNPRFRWSEAATQRLWELVNAVEGKRQSAFEQASAELGCTVRQARHQYGNMRHRTLHPTPPRMRVYRKWTPEEDFELLATVDKLNNTTLAFEQVRKKLNRTLASVKGRYETHRRRARKYNVDMGVPVFRREPNWTPQEVSLFNEAAWEFGNEPNRIAEAMMYSRTPEQISRRLASVFRPQNKEHYGLVTSKNGKGGRRQRRHPRWRQPTDDDAVEKLREELAEEERRLYTEHQALLEAEGGHQLEHQGAPDDQGDAQVDEFQL